MPDLVKNCHKVIMWICATLFVIGISQSIPIQVMAGAPANVQFSIPSVQGTVGQQVDIPVTVTPAYPGIAAYGLQLDYDKNVLEAVSVTPSYGNASGIACLEDQEGCFQSSINSASGWIRMGWFDITGGDFPIVAAKQLFVVHFKIKSSIPSGSTLLSVDASNPEKLNVTDASGNDMRALVTIGQSGLADLRELSLTTGELSPIFTAGNNGYRQSVSHSVYETSVTAVLYDPDATLTINGAPAVSGVPSAPIALSTGDNAIPVEVTAANGSYTNTYTVVVSRAPSTNAQLSSLTTSAGTLSPLFSPITTSYNVQVGQNVASLTVNAAVYEPSAKLSVNEVMLNSGTDSESILLKTGNNAIIITVTAQDGVTKQDYTVNVYRARPDRDSSSDNSQHSNDSAPTGTEPTSGNPEVTIIVDGVKQDKLAHASTEKAGDRTITTVKLDQDKIIGKLEKEGIKIITVPVAGNSEVVVGQLTGQMVKLMETKEAVLEIKTDRASYTLPASQMKIDDISSKLGSNIKLQDIIVNVKIALPSKETLDSMQKTATENGVHMAAPPVNFEVTASLGDKSVDVQRFNNYVERMIMLPAGVQASQISTGIVLNPDGSFSHVPTKIMKKDGHDYAVINSLTNSTYAVVYSPKQFADVETHWSKQDVNDMASRLIVQGVNEQSFAPDQSITRAEFISIMVRSLGIKRGLSAALPSDVRSEDWYADAVATALSYQLVSGYEDGSFRPNQTITRAEAAVILNQASKLAKLRQTTVEEAAKQLQSFNDHQAVADWAKQAMAGTVANGILQGDHQSLMPQENVTRAQTAAMMRRLLQQANLINN
ncbi:S-layer homology domain-containing protein [Paenibacillus planticolens]|uniref:SLH domain-containing protein n=1 Tax=Paenibacillus planticolens TaxID=2654976 RepID=A0ABX1ZR95_9BACL|nr:S-layer homology domain-containing protein [Paenibacillus planticolens]NOV01580.1 hypothetical protein [Paenibacillus planticolens]